MGVFTNFNVKIFNDDTPLWRNNLGMGQDIISFEVFISRLHEKLVIKIIEVFIPRLHEKLVIKIRHNLSPPCVTLMQFCGQPSDKLNLSPSYNYYTYVYIDNRKYPLDTSKNYTAIKVRFPTYSRLRKSVGNTTL